MNHHMQEEAMEAFKRNRLSKACDGDSVNIGYVDYNMGLTAAYMGQDSLSDSLFQCVIRNTQLPQSCHTATYHQLAKLYYYHFHDAATAWDYIDKYIRIKGTETGAVSVLKADILSDKKEYFSAYENYKNALQNSRDLYTRCTAYKGIAKITPFLNRSDSMQYYIEMYAASLDSIYYISRQKEVAEIQRSHVIEIHDKERAAHEARIHWIWAIAFICFAFLTGLAALLIDRKRKNEILHYENKLNDIKRRHIAKITQGEEDDQRQTDLSSMSENQKNNPRFSVQKERVNLYRKQYEQSDWVRYFQAHLLEIREGQKYMEEKDSGKFMAYLHLLFTDIFLDMAIENSSLTNQDLEYCAMSLLGFETNHIAYCLRVGANSCHSRRYRLKERLSSEWFSFLMDSSSKK
ncbi:MAG: hypothetical protein J5698_00225 [Bacteroidaceae bacterium]|nr:hypothetical protein [Bacteroidaceae bacterium]